MSKKTTPKIIEAAHRLRQEGKSIRVIAGALSTSKNVIEAALKKMPPALPSPRPAPQPPRIEVYRTIRTPAPCPETSPLVRRVYEELLAAHLLGELDCLVIAAALDVPRTRGALNVFDADSLLARIEAAVLPGEYFDLDQAVARLHSAFAEQDQERAQVRALR